MDDIAREIEEIRGRVQALSAHVVEIVSAMKREEATPIADIAMMLFAIKNGYEALDTDVKVLYHQKDFLQKNLLPQRLQALGLDMVRVPEIARSFSRQQKMSASMVDKEKAFEWLRSIGQEDMIQQTVNAGTLASFCRNLILEQGIDPPEDAVKVSTYDDMSISKYTPKHTR